MAQKKIPYYKYLANCIRVAGEELIENAESYAGDKECLVDCTITITFDQPNHYSVPHIHVEREYLPSIEKMDKLIDSEFVEEDDGNH